MFKSASPFWLSTPKKALRGSSRKAPHVFLQYVGRDAGAVVRDADLHRAGRFAAAVNAQAARAVFGLETVVDGVFHKRLEDEAGIFTA